MRGKIILKEENPIIQYLLNTKNPYKIELEDTVVEMEYIDHNKTFSECMLNILKEKVGK